MHKEFNLPYLFLILFLLVSCDETFLLNESKDTIVLSSNQSEVYIGDTLNIYGNDFSQNTKMYAAQNKDTSIFEDNLFYVNNSHIKFLNKDLSGLYSLHFKSNSKTSTVLDINFYKHPNISTKFIEPGTFQFGSETGRGDERPEVLFDITKGFEISQFEVSQDTWRKVMNDRIIFKYSITKPADNISWIDAILFCNKLSNQFELDSVYAINGDLVSYDTSANGWRLPTESEWEYAASGGNNEEYYGFSSLQVAWYQINSGFNLQPSGNLLPNSFGIFDMLGNLEEWCWDDYTHNTSIDLTLTKPINSVHVSKGGHYKSGKSSIRVSSKSSDQNESYKGLRIVRNLD
jgi:hypothetical protein